MNESTRRLIHQVNNLLSVIQVQASVARSVGSEEAASKALEMIDAAAQRTEAVVQEVRAEAEAEG